MGKNLVARLAEHDRLLSFAAMHQEFCFCCDIMQIALGRLGWGEKRMTDFRDAFEKAYDDYERLRHEDGKCDKEGEYFKACLDRELSRYSGTKFVPYEVRHRLPGEQE